MQTLAPRSEVQDICACRYMAMSIRSSYRLLLSAAVVLPLACCTPSSDPLKAVQRGDYQTAMKIWEREAEQDNSAIARNYLGILHYMGLLSGRRDTLRAASLFRQAAEQGYSPAQFNLGMLYFNGEADKKDIYQAYMWLYAANLQHNPRSRVYLDTLSSLMTINLANKAQVNAAAYVPALNRPSADRAAD